MTTASVFHTHRYSLPLVESLRAANGEVRHREGVIVGFTDSLGVRHVGEAAPLEPFTPESIEDVLSFFEKLGRTELGWLEEPIQFTAQQRNNRWPPTCSAALETLHMSILRSRGGVPLKQSDAPLRVYGLATSPGAAQNLVSRGHSAIKIKTPSDGHGAAPIIAHIERFREAIPDSIELRIDANQRWSFRTAVKVLKAAESLGVALVEEPLQDGDIRDLHALRSLTTIPIFADESVRSVPDLRTLHEGFDGIVLKPMFVGGPFRALHIARHAEALGMTCFVTTSLDAAVGRRMAAWTAQMMPRSGELPHGLSTGRMFRNDVGPAMAFDEDRLADDALSDLAAFTQEVWRRCF